MRSFAGAALAVAMLMTPARAAGPVVPYTISDGRSIDESLTGMPGDPARGMALFAAEGTGGCAVCHGLPGMPGPRTGPDLAGIGQRMTPGQLRLWIVAPKVLTPATAMPPFYAAGQRLDPADPLYGGPALTAAEVEDLVAYLAAGP